MRKGLPETWHPFSVVGEGLEEGEGEGNGQRLAFVVKEMGEFLNLIWLCVVVWFDAQRGSPRPWYAGGMID